MKLVTKADQFFNGIKSQIKKTIKELKEQSICSYTAELIVDNKKREVSLKKLDK